MRYFYVIFTNNLSLDFNENIFNQILLTLLKSFLSVEIY